MRGIPEELLNKKYASLTNEVYLFNAGKHEMLKELMQECQELQEPWIPVDENAPKDRFILCWIDDLQKKYILKFSTIRNTWLDQGLRTFMEPDLYQELPDDPVMPIHEPEPPI